MSKTPTPATCVGCEGNPTYPNIPCAVCGATHTSEVQGATSEIYESLKQAVKVLEELYPTESGGYQHSEEYRAVHAVLNRSRAALAKPLGRAGDMKARFMILDQAEAIYDGPGDSSNNGAVASLMHACDYLNDRIGYEMEPHPKGMIRLPQEPKPVTKVS